MSEITVSLDRDDAAEVLESLKWSLKRFEDQHMADPVASKQMKASDHPIYKQRERLVHLFKAALR